MSSESRFFEDRNFIHNDLEPPAARWNQLDLRFGITLPHLSRQTGGSRFIVSKRAVFDGDFHRILPLNF